MNKEQKIKIALVDDHVILRQGLKNMFWKDKKFFVTGNYNNGFELMEDIHVNTPDVVLLDIDMPIMDGKATLRALKESKPEVKVIMLSLHFTNLYVQFFYEMGAKGFLSKGTDITALKTAIKAVYEGEYYFSDNVSRFSINELVSKKHLRPTVPELYLTDVEAMVLRYLCFEYNSKDIAEKMKLSVRTIEHHRERLLEKTKTRNVIGLIIFAFYNEILNINDFPKSAINEE